MRGVILSLTCLGSGPDGLKVAEDKKEEEEVVGKELAKNDQKVILLEKPMLARKLACEEGSLILVQ